MNVSGKIRTVLPGIMMFFLPAPAQANTLSFTGAVTDTTCDVWVEVNGAAGNVVNLGRVAVGASSPEDYTQTRFTLKPDLSLPGCRALTAQSDIKISWAGDFSTNVSILPGYLLEGVLGSRTGATEAGLYWFYSNGTPDAVQFVTRSTPTVSLSGKNFLDQGAPFILALVPGSVAGIFRAAAAFVVTYN